MFQRYCDNNKMLSKCWHYYQGGSAKGLAVIETFSAERLHQTICKVAEMSGLDRATARRCFLISAQLGYAVWDNEYLTLTPRASRLGTACSESMPLPALVQPALDALSYRIAESRSVSILNGAEIVYMAGGSQ